VSLRKPLIFYHDPGLQIAGGVVFNNVQTVRERIAAGKGLPRLSVFRGCDIDDVAQLAIDVHDVTLVADELDRACTEKRFISKAVKRIVHEGRHERVDLFGTFRSTRNVSEDLIGQSDFIFLHKHTSAAIHDLQTIRQRFGERYYRAVQKLQPMEFVLWADE